ncbi:MAG: EpsG family protein, partial [Prevotellaceae bacterium]|nr:EpsG family protein [Prevotellaceae bacterium]
MIYFIIFSLLFVLASKNFFNNLSQKLEFYLVCCLFIILGGIRWKVGTDWYSYIFFFEINSSFADFMSSMTFEPGYALLNYISKAICNDYSVFLFILAFFTVLLKARPLYFFSTFPIFSLLIYFSFYLGDIAAVRQSLAISILVFSTFYIVEKKL